MNLPPTPQPNTRIGFHYYPDTNHYRECDLKKWLPALSTMGVTWLVLTANQNRAIPEFFINELISHNIEPVLTLNLPLSEKIDTEGLNLLFKAYARWGIHYVILFDRPNSKFSWPVTNWAQDDLIERFLDQYLPLANSAIETGLIPVFPPLQPGGHYWDTSFLRGALISLARRKETAILDQLVLAAYATTGEHPLDWGSGGPERWPGAHPYITPPEEQDQQGFRIFDWYLAITQATIHQSCSIILLGAGNPISSPEKNVDISPVAHATDCLSISRLMYGDEVAKPDSKDARFDPVPRQVLACNFGILVADEDSPQITEAWYKPDGTHLPAVDALTQWATHKGTTTIGQKHGVRTEGRFVIDHYLLLPSYEWGISDWHLDVIRPYVKKHQPTVGFSLKEAARARHVTVIGGSQVFSDTILTQLRNSGCYVERISGDGTSIATQLAER